MIKRAQIMQDRSQQLRKYDCYSMITEIESQILWSNVNIPLRKRNTHFR